jgi:molecular chaperone DnaJ
MAKDCYEILGVTRNASKDEIKRAYRTLAQKYHPDKAGGGDEAKFREINEAYEVLSDDAKRSQYDQFGQTFEQARAKGYAGFGGFGGFSDFADFMRGFGDNYSRGPFSGIDFDFGDIFSDIFGTPRQRRRDQGIDLEVAIKISFLESVFGTEKEITLDKKDACPVCQGQGAENGSQIISCGHCHGTGQITDYRRTPFGSFQQLRPCETCEGSGKIPEKKCRECRGSGVKRATKKLEVIIPPGIEEGQRLKMTAEGEVGYRGSSSGDLYVVIRIEAHPEFRRERYNILSEIPVSFAKAALGGKAGINTVDGKIMLKIPAGIQSGKVLRLRGKGVPHLESTKRGDHLVTVQVVTPVKLTRKEKDLYKKLAEERGESLEIDEDLWDKIKKTL